MNKIDIINNYKLQNFDYSNFIGVPLDKQDKKVFCELLDLRDYRGRTLKWQSVKNMLTNYYFNIVNKTIRINGKQIRVSYIIDELENK